MEIGSKAPEVLGHDENGNEVRLSQFKGKKLSVVFLPQGLPLRKHNTSLQPRDNYEELKKQGYEVVGVSINDRNRIKSLSRKTICLSPLLPM